MQDAAAARVAEQVVLLNAKPAPATEAADGTVSVIGPTPVLVRVAAKVVDAVTVTLPKASVGLREALEACPAPTSVRLPAPLLGPVQPLDSVPL